jgi:predicted Zn-dependent protease
MEQSIIDSVEFALKYLGRFSDYSEARLESTESSGFMMKNGLLEASSQESYHGAGFRFLIGKSLGFFSTDNLSKDSIRKLAEKSILATKKASKIAEDTSFSDEKPYSAKYGLNEKEKIADFSPESKISVLRDVDSAVKNTAADRYFSKHD